MSTQSKLRERKAGYSRKYYYAHAKEVNAKRKAYNKAYYERQKAIEAQKEMESLGMDFASYVAYKRKEKELLEAQRKEWRREYNRNYMRKKREREKMEILLK